MEVIEVNNETEMKQVYEEIDGLSFYHTIKKYRYGCNAKREKIVKNQKNDRER